jgi:outer membrane protein TolC
MGLPDDANVRFVAEFLPDLPAGPEVELAQAILAASTQRPEWAEIENGKAAALALAQADTLANAPVVYAGGMFSVDWAPTRDHTSNPYLSDPYNGISGGVAVGLQFDVDPALHQAKQQGARAMADEVEAMARFAQTGIPMQVKRAHQDVLQYRELVGITDRGVGATKRWMTFAAAAYTTGTGEARDVLEGLASYVQARHANLEVVQNYFVARAELDYAVGATP